MATRELVQAPLSAPLFSQVSFHIVRCGKIDHTKAQLISDKLIKNGAFEHSPPSESGVVDSRGLTHIISSTIDFESYDEFSSMYINVVTPSWVDVSILKKRLANPKSHSPNPRLFYSGLVVCTADLPEGDKDAIIGGVLAMGGLYSASISKLVTHVVALSMEPQACQVAKAKHLPCKIVLPHWFDDCLRLGKKIDEGPYLLPKPDLMKKTSSSPIGTSVRPDLDGSLCPVMDQPPLLNRPSALQREQTKIFASKSVMLFSDLGITDHLRAAIEDIIRRGQGTITHTVGDADICICQYRDGDNYIAASLAGKIVGNLPWLYYLLTHGSWTSPMKRLLHYPAAREGLPGFKGYRISLSNYNGEARVYLENLVKAAGCVFTKTMKQDNTHLITAHMVSEKCEAAKEWNIHTVNHLWLEESYAKWQVQSVSNPRYNHFPPRTNLSEVVGQTSIDKDAVHRHFLAKHSKNQRVAGSNSLGLVARQDKQSLRKECTIEVDDNKTLGILSSEALPRCSHERTSPCLDQSSERESKAKLKMLVGDDKENDTLLPSVNRGAKAKAVARLHELAPDIELYQKEMKRTGGVVFGGRPREGEIVDVNLKRQSSPLDESTDEQEGNLRLAKKSRQSKSPLRMRVLVTGYSRWADDNRLYMRERDRLRTLGILLVEDYKTCGYLAAPKILRTQKFCCAIAHGPLVVSTKYLEDCLKESKLLGPESYYLADHIGEEHYGLNLQEVLKRAQINKGRLLQGRTIWITEGIHGGFESYRAIIEVNGGSCALYRGRTGKDSKSIANGQSDSDDEPEYAYLVSGPTKNEARLWPRFCQMANAAGIRPKVVRTDWVLDMALSQELQWKDRYELTKADLLNEAQAT